MQKSLMPKGVDHPFHRYEEFLKEQVQKSLMPKGVDHRRLDWATRSVSAVQKSLMPKGVDHFITGEDTVLRDWLVQKSLMPKGVDHPIPPVHFQPPAFGAKIFDAERR